MSLDVIEISALDPDSVPHCRRCSRIYVIPFGESLCLYCRRIFAARTDFGESQFGHESSYYFICERIAKTSHTDHDSRQSHA